MKTYTLTQTASLEVPCPDVLPEAGESYVVARAFHTPRCKYFIGDVLTLIHRTQEAPHGTLSSLGNWAVKDSNVGISIWSNIEMAIFDGLLVKAEGEQNA